MSFLRCVNCGAEVETYGHLFRHFRTKAKACDLEDASSLKAEVKTRVRTISEIENFCEAERPTAEDDYADGYRQALDNVLAWIRNPDLTLDRFEGWYGIRKN